MALVGVNTYYILINYKYSTKKGREGVKYYHLMLCQGSGRSGCVHCSGPTRARPRPCQSQSHPCDRCDNSSSDTYDVTAAVMGN